MTVRVLLVAGRRTEARLAEGLRARGYEFASARYDVALVEEPMRPDLGALAHAGPAPPLVFLRRDATVDEAATLLDAALWRRRLGATAASATVRRLFSAGR